jgi:hypothetical protein
MNCAHCSLDRRGFPTLEKWVTIGLLTRIRVVAIEYRCHVFIYCDTDEKARDLVCDGKKRDECRAAVAVVQRLV